jgi:hypothetical protein
MLPTLSAERRIKRHLDDLQATVTFLAILDGQISDSRLSIALRGLKNLENNDSIRLLELLERCIRLRDSFEPIPLSFDQPASIKVLLQNFTASDEEIQRAVAGLFE